MGQSRVAIVFSDSVLYSLVVCACLLVACAHQTFQMALPFRSLHLPAGPTFSMYRASAASQSSSSQWHCTMQLVRRDHLTTWSQSQHRRSSLDLVVIALLATSSSSS